MQQAEPKTKTYILLPHLRPSAKVYRRISKNQRMRVDKRPYWKPYLKYTFTNEQNRQVTVRLKLNSNTILQDEQIKNGIPANEKFTPSEYKVGEFKHGVYTTNKKIVQDFLESIPAYKGFKGYREGQPAFELYDPQVKLESDDNDFMRRVEAATVIAKLSPEEGQNLLYKLYGSSFKAPSEKLEIRSFLIQYLDNADDKGIDKILEKEVTLDDEATIILGKAITKGIISFDSVPNQVVKKVGTKDVSLKQISSDLHPEERQSKFLEYLTSEDGKPLLEELENEVNKGANKGVNVENKKEPVS